MPRRLRSRFAAGLTVGALAGAGLVALPAPSAQAVPSFTATTIVSGLTIPWDLTWVGSRMLYTLRVGEVWSKTGSAAPRRVLDLKAQTFASGEGGLLGIVAAPDAATSRVFYTCGTYKSGGVKDDVRVRRWQLNTGGTGASNLGTIVDDLPLGTGRHSGCRLRFGTDGRLYVGTGDAAGGTNPQNLASLGGKVLRVNSNGSIPSDNPYASRSDDGRYVWTYGHRNVQGLALRPGTDQLWSAEHGPGRDDEVNLIARGGNYGWNPVPGYNESVPMTRPGAVPARWSSGAPTVATSGLTFLSGSAWGRWQGAMAVGLLKDSGIMILTLRTDGTLASEEPLRVAEGYGRIRTVQQGPDGALYFTTSNGSGRDRIVRLTPRPPRPLPAYQPGLDVSPVGVAAARTGSSIYAFVRSTGDVVYYKRSTDNGRTWGSWISTGVTSTSAPAVASSASGRIDLLTRNSSNRAVHTWFANGVPAGENDLGGYLSSAPAVSSLGDGTLDVFVRNSANGASRKHYDGDAWSPWQGLGGQLTSALAASANRSTDITTVTGRGTDSRGWQKTVSATGNVSGWASNGLTLWSARALGDTTATVGPVGVSSGSDTNAVVDRVVRGRLVMGVTALYNSAPAVVTRTEGEWAGGWIMFGRSTNGGLWLYDARPGGYRSVSLGGVVR